MRSADRVWRVWRSLSPWRTVRMRLTLLFCGLILLSGAGLLATTYVLMLRATTAGVPSTPGDAALAGRNHGSGGGAAHVDPLTPSLPDQMRQQRAEQLQQLVTQSGIALALMSVASIGLGWMVAG